MTYWWFTHFLNNFGPVVLAAWCIWGVVSVLLHELAHGWAAVRRGDPTPIDTGHMTWNPLVHMGLMGVIMFVLVGLPMGAMPIDPTRMRGRYAHTLVALAGPLMNLGLAALCIVVGGVMAAFLSEQDLDRAMQMEISSSASPLLRLVVFCFVGSWINLALGIFNLFPLPPLDGSRIMSELSAGYARFVESDAGRFLSIFLFMVAFFFVGRVLYPVALLGTAVSMGSIGMLLRALGIGP